MIRGSSMRRRIAEILEGSPSGDHIARWVNLALLGLIALNVLAMILETIEAVEQSASEYFHLLEVISIGVFTGEYVLRLWSCVELPKFRRPLLGRLRFALTLMALVDLIAIAPFFLSTLLPADLRSVRALRLFRLFRLIKIGRYSGTLRTFGKVMQARREELVTLVLFMLALLVVSATVMYFAERDAQPEKFSSIPATMWWAISTLTTVGYGDVYPVTVIGRFLASAIAVLGIGMFALPTGVLGAAFVDELRSQSKVTRCPQCGVKLPNG